MSLNGNINLMKFKGARKVAISGERGIFIPVDTNPTIYAEGKGAYLSIRVVEKESTFEDKHYTHFVSASLAKKKRDELEAKGYTKEQIYDFTPILGNLETYEPEGGSSEFEQEEAEDLPF